MRRAELDPGASTECVSAARKVTQDDLDAGAVSDAVRVVAASRGGALVEETATASVSTTAATASAALALRAVSVDHPGVGETVRLQATIRNTGNVSVRDLAVTLPEGSPFQVSCPEGPSHRARPWMHGPRHPHGDTGRRRQGIGSRSPPA